ncbi:uncharacterized protein BYT42DRAFT_503966 [Radiomyces spectabilis]|uniref:uncharacterized protein n=1 Tax=Radiomyces spectabilis TaxID=64574 RepID=UPI002220D32B|nr:uncharacterized protein BYT42DRAFT_503966 [Radiomyces spectabilis]KAI8368112.1 hypothetical protein BYT42DRAFT_503966 [Radiomyces spectabilis]
MVSHLCCSVAFLHFSTHIMASIFYNKYHSHGLKVDGVVNAARLNELESHIKELKDERQSCWCKSMKLKKKKKIVKKLLS